MKPVFSTDQRSAPYLAKDKDFARWFVEEWMPDHLNDFLYRQDPEVLKTWVIRGRHRAIHFGIKDTESQLQFVNFSWEVGPTFWSFPGFFDVAVNPHLDGPNKINGFHNVPEDLAVEAIMNYDPGGWEERDLPPLRTI